MRSIPNILSMVYDRKRGLFYGLSRGSGMLAVIKDSTGETIKTAPVGAKPDPLWFDLDADKLILGSSLGILEIDLKRFLGGSLGLPRGAWRQHVETVEKSNNEAPDLHPSERERSGTASE